MPIDKAKFAAALKEAGLWNGGRALGMATDPDAAKVTPETASIEASAIAISVLIDLRKLADAKPLRPGDVQAYIDAFMEGAKVDEQQTPMGGNIIVRKAS